ncbi:MAG: SpoIIE family protein phosphatase [Candidatus Baltobacteraceae bacterium]
MAIPTENRDQQRLAFLVRAGEIFHQSLDVAETLNNVARLAVESFSDLCLFDLLDERSERLFVTAAAHRDPALQDALASVASILYVEEFGVHPVVRVTRTGIPFFLPHIDEETLLSHAASRQHEQYMRRFAYRSKIVVPVTAQNQIFGALTFVRTGSEKEFDTADLSFAIELGRRAGLAVANAKQFHREQYVAETLQRSFLPRDFPSRSNIDMTAHYRPGSTEADVGGDWYDAFEKDNGEIVVTIGDVTGKGIQAARLMVVMRHAIRFAAVDTGEPTDIVEKCNRLLMAEHDDGLASAFVGVISPQTGRLRYVSAGHAPPLLRLPDGSIAALESPSPPLGAFKRAVFEAHEIVCPDGSMLALYTDGLIEVSRDALIGEEILKAVISSDAFVHAANPAEFAERAIGRQAPRDDIAILVVRFGPAELRWQFEASDARAAYAMREQYYETIRGRCAPTEDDLMTCGLLFSELVGNAVRHAPGPLSVTLEFRGESLVLHLIDRGSGFDLEPNLPLDLWSENGRGLFLVSALAQDLSVDRIPGLGSHIAATLPVTCSRMRPSGNGASDGRARV